MLIKGRSMVAADRTGNDWKEVDLAKIKKRTLRWKASPSPQVVGYKLYWSEQGSVSYDSPCVKLGNVTEIILPDDVKAFADINGPVELGIAAMDEMGNESDLITLKTPYQFRVPQAPADLHLEAQNNFHTTTVVRQAGGPVKVVLTDAHQHIEPDRSHKPEFNPAPPDRSDFGEDIDILDAEDPEDLTPGTMSQGIRRF
jgi:hypothetical protein